MKDQVEQIIEDSARFNIGNVQRTINVPVLALIFLRHINQSSFSFVLRRRERLESKDVEVIDYEERATPTIVQGAEGRNVPSHGRFWIESNAGRVIRSELRIDDIVEKMHIIITTRFTGDSSFGVLVPFEMREEYLLDSGERIHGVATYSNFRQFKVNTSEALKKYH
jgi:hypothetical protein